VAPILVIDGNGANLKTTRNTAILFVIATLFFVAQVSAQEPGAKHGAVKGIVSLESGTLEQATPEGIALELKRLRNGSAPTTAITDAGGNFEFTGLADGEYVLHLLGDGFEPFTATVRIEDGATVAQNVLVKLTGLTQRVEVKERAEPLSTSSSSASKFTDKQLSGLPLVEENFKELLPLTPGVIRTPDGKLTFRGAGEGQSMLQVNDFKMTDPVTGSFSIPVPLDGVQSVRVVKTPYSAENGGFSGGLTEVETVPPPESWKVAVRDLNVSLRGKNDHFVGIGRATPRVVFGGPLLKDKLSFSEVYEYDVTRDPVRGLAWPRNEIKKQGFTSYTTLQAILCSKHVITATLNVFPQRTQFANITALIPQTASSDYDRKGASVSLSDVYSFPSGALFRMGLTYTRFDSNAHGQGGEPMLLTPAGWDGNFFNAWARSAGQFEASPTFQSAQRHFRGRHEIRVGGDVTHRSFRGSSMSQPIRIVRQDGSIAEEIRFTNQTLVNESITDIEEFVADHWSLGEHLAVDLGARLTSQSIGRAAAFAPRFGVAYSPGKDQKTVVRAGIGVFYNHPRP
jgi:Carboxypeptidase regulatory-like domain/TonB dependent receptor/TonB-dependent Receptor Plug Domain